MRHALPDLLSGPLQKHANFLAVAEPHVCRGIQPQLHEIVGAVTRADEFFDNGRQFFLLLPRERAQS